MNDILKVEHSIHTQIFISICEKAKISEQRCVQVALGLLWERKNYLIQEFGNI